MPTDGDKIMRYFATETGGLAFFPFKAEDLSQSFENIANELRHQYNICIARNRLSRTAFITPWISRFTDAAIWWFAPAKDITRRRRVEPCNRNESKSQRNSSP